ncbi:MAG: transcription termination/antitermination protein NusA [Phascolarctobacterium sp.]|nr:transcription termination/antitermination protein NusA [Candidatus Phascolarctobacterium caballi]MCQ2380756.1 transcription termination factor NusA [Acidaminococcaceae bacterium]
MNSEFISAINDIAKEKNIDADVLFSAVEDALVAAYKKVSGTDKARVELNKETGEMHLYAVLTVVEGEGRNASEISLKDAQEVNPDFAVGDVVEREIQNKEFGRLAALTAKQVVIQRIHEAEQDYVDKYFHERQNDVVTGAVQRKEGSNVYFDLGNVDGVLMKSEQIPGERYENRERMKLYVLDVRKTRLGPQVIVSRTHPGLMRKLLEREVPEIEDGTVIIKSVAREPGYRSKVAVYTDDKDIDPVGACVGARGGRVQGIVNELHGEKIDVIKFSENPAEYVANSLSPSKVVEAKANEEEKICRVVVPDYQLSLAIGKEGQNARLAAKLTGWKIDIKSESQAAEDNGEVVDADDKVEENSEETITEVETEANEIKE